MQLKQLSFVHFFLAEKEYLLEVDTINNVIISKDTVQVLFKSNGEILPVTEFFVKYAESEVLFFFGNSEVKYDSPVVSRTCYFFSSYIKDNSFCLEFKIRS
jgi:hypothetical protein